MRTFAIGDVHGCITALDALLRQLRVQQGDRIVFLGDLVDRGPDSFSVVEIVIQLVDSGLALCILGNHEEMLLGAQHDERDAVLWRHVGGEAALDSYLRHTGERVVDARHLTFFQERCLPHFEDSGFLYAHACPDPELALPEQSPADLRWTKWRDQGPHVSGKTLVVGHTAMKDGLPLDEEHAVVIDTYCYGGEWLTAFETTGDRFIQANELGEVREFSRRSGPVPPAGTF